MGGAGFAGFAAAIPVALIQAQQDAAGGPLPTFQFGNQTPGFSFPVPPPAAAVAEEGVAAAADAAAPLEEDAPQKLEAAAGASLSAAAPDFVPSTIVPAGDDTDSIATPLHGEDSAAAQASVAAEAEVA